jgi:glycosyltransferase involved in cell wall biosynthesis
LKEIQPDIVHGQGTENECAITAAFSGFQNVVTIHGNMRLISKVNQVKPFSFLWLAARLETFTLPRTRGVVCITRYTQAAVATLAKRTWVLPNAVDGSFFDVDSAPSPNAPPRILCVGLICMRKNQNAFIRALDAVASNRKFEMLFLGNVTPGRPYDDEFLALVRERSWCRHAGFADREALKAHFRDATLLALPSLEDNCPMAVLEAMATGVPVMAANVGGVPDLVDEGETGLMCDPLNAESMAGAVEKALGNPAALMEVARKAKTRARERFHPLVVAKRHLEIYREVLK